MTDRYKEGVVGSHQPESPQFGGGELFYFSEASRHSTPVIQVYGIDDGPFTVELEGGVSTKNGVRKFGTVMRIHEDQNCNVIPVPFSAGCRYRVKHLNGVDVRWMVSG